MQTRQICWSWKLTTMRVQRKRPEMRFVILRLGWIAKWAIVKGKSVIVRVTLENAILTYTNARSMDVTSSEARYEQNRLRYSRKFGETYYRGPGWSKAIDFTTRFGFSKRIARALLKKGVSHDERERSLPRDRLYKFFVANTFVPHVARMPRLSAEVD